MVNKNAIKIVEKLKNMYIENGGRSIAFVELEKKFYKTATIEDLRYFFKHCRDEKGPLFHEQDCISYMLNKSLLFSAQMFNCASPEQKRIMLKKVGKVKYEKYIFNMFLLCTQEFRKEELMLAKQLIKTKYVSSAIKKPGLNPDVKDYLIKGAAKNSKIAVLLDILKADKTDENVCLTKKQRSLIVSSICKHDNIAFFTNFLFSNDLLNDKEMDRVVYALGKYAEPDQIQETIKLYSRQLTRDNINYLKNSCSDKVQIKFYTRK